MRSGVESPVRGAGVREFADGAEPRALRGLEGQAEVRGVDDDVPHAAVGDVDAHLGRRERERRARGGVESYDRVAFADEGRRAAEGDALAAAVGRDVGGDGDGPAGRLEQERRPPVLGQRAALDERLGRKRVRRSRSVDPLSGTIARGTCMLKRT